MALGPVPQDFCPPRFRLIFTVPRTHESLEASSSADRDAMLDTNRQAEYSAALAVSKSSARPGSCERKRH